MEGDTLFAHRSWTGVCIYRVDFKPDNNHLVTVNRDPEQYKCTSIEEDVQQLNGLLNWWTQDSYDYYGEWLAETADTLKKAGRIPDKLIISGREADAVFFHDPAGPNGHLSNWYPSAFELDGTRFSSAEQYIMYRKCMIFGDEEAARAVLSADDPSKQQEIGRKAKGYVGSVWAGMRQTVAFEGLLAKFSRNEELKQKLLDTGDAYLVECAGSDKIWACGIRIDDDRRFNASDWEGQNLLGFALMQVRKELNRFQTR
ncbi:MAG: NADAR family protein [Clostridia bacterium]|nr:NADAR family protein [Clostridia bacterium]